MTPSLGIKPGPYWWEASALTTAPSLHPKLKDKNTHPSHFIYKGECICGQTYIGETARNLEVRVNEHSDVDKHSEPAKHIRKHPNHKLTWEVLTTAQSRLKRRIKEAFYISRFRPELNKQVQSLDLTLFTACYGMLQFVTPCYSLLQLVTVCYGLLRFVTACYVVVRLVRACYSLLRLVTDCYGLLRFVMACYGLLRLVTLWYDLLRHITVCYGLLRRGTACYGLLRLVTS